MNLLIGIAAPTAIAAALVWLIRRVARPDPADRYVFAAAAAAAILAGYWAIPGFAAVVPASRWQWLPYLAVMASVVSWLPTSPGAFGAARWLLLAAAAALAAWKLVPDWPDLWPPRLISVALLATGLLLLTALLEWLPVRGGDPKQSAAPMEQLAFPALLTLAACAVTVVLVAASISVKYAQVGGLLAGALAGCTLAGWWSPATAPAYRGLVPVYALILGGLAYIGCIEKETPILAVLALPLAPAALWALQIGPLSRLQGAASIVAQVLCVAIPLAIAGAIACIPPPPPTW